MYGDENKPISGASLREKPRDLGADGAGYPQQGYARMARRPRVAGYDTWTTPAEADTLEWLLRGHSPLDY
jgi:hypothetical protein